MTKNDLLNSLASSLNSLYADQRELAAIWLNKPLLTAQGKSIRIAPGDLVKVENGELVDCTDRPTHKVIGCYGTLINQFEFTLIDVNTNEPMQLKLISQ